MRISVDETSVEYLLSECSDQFICSLKKTNIWWGVWDGFSITELQSWVCRVECINSHLSNSILVFWFLPHCWFCTRCRTLLSTLSLKRRENNDKALAENTMKSIYVVLLTIISSPYLSAPRRLWEQWQSWSVSAPLHTSLNSCPRSQSPALEPTYPLSPTESPKKSYYWLCLNSVRARHLSPPHTLTVGKKLELIPDLKHPSESKAWVHELDNIQEDLQGSDITIKPIPEVDVLHLWGPEVNTNRLLNNYAQHFGQSTV